jgi:hypothetical protein
MTMEIKTTYPVFNHQPSDRFTAKHKGYCSRCHITFWKGESVVKNPAGFVHIDCLVAIADPTPRTFNPKWMALPGEGPDMKILKKKAKKKIAMAR